MIYFQYNLYFNEQGTPWRELGVGNIYKRPPCYRPSSLPFLCTRFGGGTTPAEQRGDPDLPGLWPDRWCHLLHQRPGVGRHPASTRGHRWWHSSPRRGQRGLESTEGEDPFWLVSVAFEQMNVALRQPRSRRSVSMLEIQILCRHLFLSRLHCKALSSGTSLLTPNVLHWSCRPRNLSKLPCLRVL